MRSTNRALAAVCVALLAAPAFADVKAGDTVTAANSDAVKGLIPDELVPFVIDGFDGLEMKIVATGDYPPPARRPWIPGG